MLVSNNNTDNVFPIGLRLEPKKKGLILGLEEIVDEKLYKMLISGNSLTTETNKGKVELGYTETSGVVVKMAFSTPILFDEGISVMTDMAKSIISTGVKDDPGFSGKPRKDLEYSLKTMELVLDDSLVKAYPKLTRYPFSTLSRMRNNPYVVNTYEKVKLIPDGYELEFK